MRNSPRVGLARGVAACVLAFSAGLAFSQGQAPIRGLSQADAARLESGQAVIREVRDPRSLALAAAGEFADRLRSRVASLKPNYLSEVILEVPAKDGAIESLARALADVKGYVGIQYWSERQQKYYDLFDKMDIVSRQAVPGGEDIETLEHMEPFSDFKGRYSYRTAAGPTGTELSFECENGSEISYSYRGVNAVSPGNMLWMLYAFPSRDRIVFYGVGAVRAFDLFGAARERLKISFLGRVEAFFGHMSQKLKD